MLDQYIIERTIGEGGSGVVLKAKQKSADRVVAIKMLAQSLIADDKSMQRFQREAKTLCALDHPNIVRIYSFGVSDDNRPFFVMEYLEGRTLQNVLQQDGKFDLKRFESIFSQVCSALDYAHGQGIVHRDIKPANIMIAQDLDHVEIAKLLDFGIARKQEAEDNSAVKITQTGALVGSPAYMSPEQCRGENLDMRSDVYSLGCVMYQCLAGRAPFVSENIAEILMNHLKEAPPPMETVARGLVLPPGLPKLIYACLNKDPADRPASAAEIRQILQAACSQKVIRLDHSPRRLQTLLLKCLAGILVLASFACVSTVLFNYWQQKKASSTVDGSWILLDRAIATAGAAYDRKEYSKAIQLYEEAIKAGESIEKSKNSSMKLAGKLFECYRRLNHANLELKGYDLNQRQHWSRMNKTATLAFRGEAVEAESQNELARIITEDPLSTRDDLDEAIRLLQKSVKFYKERIASMSDQPIAQSFTQEHIHHDEARLSLAHSTMALTLERIGKLDEALEQLNKSSSIFMKLDIGDSIYPLLSIVRYCRIYHLTNNTEKEQKELSELLNKAKTDKTIPTTYLVAVLVELCDFYIHVKDLKKAELVAEVFMDAAIRSKAQTAIALAHCCQSRVYLRQGKKKEALAAADEARKILDNCPATFHPVPSWILLSKAYIEAGASKQADACQLSIRRIEGH